jgi:hypothetical protein
VKVLLDEDVPVQVRDLLRLVLSGHDVDHVNDLKWKGKTDRSLLVAAARRGYDVFVTNDVRQLADPDECDAIKAAGIHHVTYTQRRPGKQGLAFAIAAIVAAMPGLVAELEKAGGQRLAAIAAISPSDRFDVRDPAVDPPAYWR